MSEHNLKPLSEVIKDLQDRGYKQDYILRGNRLYSIQDKKSYDPKDITIKKDYRFEGDSDPADMSILYAIETSSGEKGTLVDSYGVGSDIDLEKFLDGAHFEEDYR